MKKFGQNIDAPFCAFGDDSHYKDILVYAYAIFRRSNIPKAKKVLRKAKKNFGIPKFLPIHCRILFSGDQRRKVGLGLISIVRVKDFVSYLIKEMNNVPCLLRYAHCKVPDDGRVFLDVLDVEEKRVRDEPKGILGILSGGCFTPNNDAIQAPGIELCEIFASEDSTKIRFIGKGRRRADSYLSTMAFEDKKTKLKKHLRPHIKEHVLQQMADVYAYICSHALSEQCEDDFFKEQLANIKYYTSAECIPDSQFENAGVPFNKAT